MKKSNRRVFNLAALGLVAGAGAAVCTGSETNQETDQESANESSVGESPTAEQTVADNDEREEMPDDADPAPRQPDFERDYVPPSFQPKWENPQLNRIQVQDFVIYAHSDLEMVRTLLEKEPRLLNATIDWGNGDFESALGGASHMGRKEIVGFLLSKGARIDIFCAAMLGMFSTVEEMLNVEPALIDAKGPHGFSLHFHAQVGQEDSKAVLDHLQSIKEVELRPVPFLKNDPPAETNDKK